jgi:hypothetical protein
MRAVDSAGGWGPGDILPIIDCEQGGEGRRATNGKPAVPAHPMQRDQAAGDFTNEGDLQSSFSYSQSLKRGVLRIGRLSGLDENPPKTPPRLARKFGEVARAATGPSFLRSLSRVRAGRSISRYNER